MRTLFSSIVVASLFASGCETSASISAPQLARIEQPSITISSYEPTPHVDDTTPKTIDPTTVKKTIVRRKTAPKKLELKHARCVPAQNHVAWICDVPKPRTCRVIRLAPASSFAS